ncbi:PABP-interacting PAM2 motif-containing protein [Spiroplasma endosymbiont of Aleiodes alternator]|uniref:PABP-interacting PAM2 motif-containing protein n=1 Tax=Spiroplasma endosymbiont of Aleiodes alternator TaxID=3139329 RepID=UPI003CCAC288
MKKTKNYTNLQLLNEIIDNKNNIFEIHEFGHEKVIEWINKHQDEFRKTIEKSKKVSLLSNNIPLSNLNPNAKAFYPRSFNIHLENLKLLADVAEKQNYLRQATIENGSLII